MSASATKILIHESDPAARASLRGVLGAIANVELLDEKADPNAVPGIAPGECPDVVVLGPGPPSADIADLIQHWRGLKDGLLLLAVLPAERVGTFPVLVEAGVAGFVSPVAEATEFATALRTVREGGAYLSLDLLNALCEPLRGERRQTPAFGLTARERQVLALIAVNMSNKDMARKLDLSVRTVETHRLNIRKKTKVGTRQQLAEIAGKLGLLGDYPFPPGLAERRVEAGFQEEPAATGLENLK